MSSFKQHKLKATQRINPQQMHGTSL